MKLSEKLTVMVEDSSYVKIDITQQLPQFKRAPAKVVNDFLEDANNLIIIDKGPVNGVRKDVGVISGIDAMGIVYLVSSYYVVVIPPLDTRPNVSCKIENRDHLSFPNWQGGSTDQASLDDIPRHVCLGLHENIVASGYLSVFPPGTSVGKILHVYNPPDDVSYRLCVQLATDFATLRDASAIGNTPVREWIRVMRTARDSMEMRDNQSYWM